MLPFLDGYLFYMYLYTILFIPVVKLRYQISPQYQTEYNYVFPPFSPRENRGIPTSIAP